jgi:hypothetical protein
MISERAFARAFDSFWHELFPLLTPHFVAVFNEAYLEVLTDSVGNILPRLPIPDDIERMDVVAEFSFRLAKELFNSGLELIDAGVEECIARAEKEALMVIEQFERESRATGFALSEGERQEGFRLCGRYSALYQRFSDSDIEFCPRLPGAGFLDSAEGDLSLGDCLIEVKTTTRKTAGKDLRQLIIYVALNANAGHGNRWKRMGIFNPRRGTLQIAEIEPLILRLSGGVPRSDVLADLIGYLESNEPSLDMKF